MQAPPADPGQVLARPGLTAAVWLPGGTMLTPAVHRALLDEHGIGVWTRASGTAACGPGYSFGPLALLAHKQCSALGCTPRTGGPRALARHLVAEHQVPVAGPSPGLTDWTDGEQRARVLLAGKDESLRRLAHLLPTVQVDVGQSLGRERWECEREAAVTELLAAYPGRGVIVRSCAVGEDGWEHSAAGAYASVAVPDPDRATVEAAVEEVFASYPVTAGGRVLVQGWLNPVEASAVVTGRTLVGGPYVSACVDAVSGRTDTITSGEVAAETWVLRHRHGAVAASGVVPDAAGRLVAAAAEVGACAGTNRLDLELAVYGGQVHLLQARPLAAAPASVDDAPVHAAVERARGLLEVLDQGPRGLLLSSMSDWNPAEMIGRRPSQLAVSLYRELITDATWAEQRVAYGYRDLRGTVLLHEVAGHAFIDTTASLASFVPAALDDRLAAALVRAQLERLRADPAAHDKLEFEVALTCWSPLLAERTGYLAGHGIGRSARERLHRQLAVVTAAGIARLDGDLADLAALAAPTPADADPARLAPSLEVARRAARVFAHLARAAFVATDLLRALEAMGLAPLREAWMRGLGTVAAELQTDAAAVREGQLGWERFVDRYWWMRPGTYDLTVPSYGDDPDGYLRPLLSLPNAEAADAAPAPWPGGSAGEVTAAMAPLDVDAAALERFCRAAIRAREEGKARYAAWVSVILECCAARGAAAGLGRQQVQHLRLEQLLSDDRARWPDLARGARHRAGVHALVELPDVITSPGDVDVFRRDAGRANFVGTGRTSGPVCLRPKPEQPPEPGAVVVLEAADPGMDWVFAHPIVALVTAYGGANSHMAIRCAELGLPAAIGVGPQQYEACRTAAELMVDAGAGRLQVLR
ncbi:PEP-utilizing enzyme [Kitasatospora indigofera]|uniref:PEP-utilizing enzyme n=1 Tax=Kitasatospora indigofera TaxID=67307 RepID=UPI0036A9E204